MDVKVVSEWNIQPYLRKTAKKVTYSTSWIGIDAYRSSVGMSKGRTETKEISEKLGFSGSAEIKKAFKASFSTEYIETASTTVSENQTCPAWTTMNWRPYLLFFEDYYYGKMKTTTTITTPYGVTKNVIYKDHIGINKRKITSSTEVWARENVKRNIKATTPMPPTDAPKV